MPRAMKLNEFMFLISVRVPQLTNAARPHRDVGVDTKSALLHLRVGDAELDDRLAEELQEALRLVGRVDVGRVTISTSGVPARL